MEEKVMNKRFDVYEKRPNPREPRNSAPGDRAVDILYNVVRHEDNNAYDMYYELDYKCHSTYHFTYEKFRRKGLLDSEITSAIETLMKYGFLVKVDNNTAYFYDCGNEELIASMIKENA